MGRAAMVGVMAAVALAGGLAGSAAAQPAQYTKDDVIKAFSKPAAAPSDPAATPAPGDCPEGTTPGDDGVCQPLMHNSRGFSLVAPKSAATGARKAPARAVAAAARAPARPVRLAKAAVSPGDLLITFRTGSADLTDQGRANARVFAAALNSPALAAARFEIAGHTDSVGAAAKNMTLSQSRAEAVRAQLVQDGVEAGRLTARGYGSDQPVAGLGPAAAANRRVEAHRVDAQG